MVGINSQPVNGTYSGDIHIGTGKAHGMGILRFENGEFYAGTFLDDMFTGCGKSK